MASQAMTLTVDPFAYRATLLSTAALVTKMFLTISIQGGTRFAAGTRPPEDQSLGLTKLMAKGAQQSYGLNVGKEEDKLKKAKMIEIRWQRIVWNDLENIPVGLVLAWSGLLTPASPKLHAALVTTFAVVRILHTVCYAKQIQPWRAIAWFAGWIASFGLVGNSLAGAFGLTLPF
ncbi:hypothetical protein HDU96_007996 [Phlyctochytrium bullatum]|nr:hypothetical protein HDU96_007996 [Phlyctochytrium bullatum]